MDKRTLDFDLSKVLLATTHTKQRGAKFFYLMMKHIPVRLISTGMGNIWATRLSPFSQSVDGFQQWQESKTLSMADKETAWRVFE
jgi:hypothetical protein